ncbi:amino acid permease/ SLC12A domain-containing protein [Aspergillus californicus]
MSQSESSSIRPPVLQAASVYQSTPSRQTRELNPDAGLKPYQVTLITIGSAINTGLLIAFGNALSRSGPASTLISYTFVGAIVFLVLSALGEVASFSPEPTTVHTHANRFCGPSLGFTLGWIYWLKYMMLIISQLTAGIVVIKYWKQDRAGDLTPAQIGEIATYITVFLFVIVGMNYWSSQFLGRYEVVLSSFKVLIVLGLMILSLVIACGGGPSSERKGYNYWKMPEAFNESKDWDALGVFRAIFRTFPSTTLSYLGTELIGMAVLHTREPRKAAARAVKQTFYRILAFNLVVVTLLGMAVPPDDDELALPTYASKRSASAFVVAVQMARIPVLPHILNACILIFVVSAAGRSLCMAARIIHELSMEKHAPVFLRQTDKRGVPVYALGFSAFPALLGYLNLVRFSGHLWTYLVNLVTMFSILTWVSILMIHISFVRACKSDQIPPGEIPFKAPFGVTGSWIALVLSISIPVMRAIELSDRKFYDKGIDVGAFVTSYLGIPLYLILVLGYKVVINRQTRQNETRVESLPVRQSLQSLRGTETDGAGLYEVSAREKTLWKGRRIPLWLL